MASFTAFPFFRCLPYFPPRFEFFRFLSTGIIAAIEVILDLGWRFIPISRIRRYRATEVSKCLRRYAFTVSHFRPALPCVFNCAHGPRALSYRFPPRYQGATYANIRVIPPTLPSTAIPFCDRVRLKVDVRINDMCTGEGGDHRRVFQEKLSMKLYLFEWTAARFFFRRHEFCVFESVFFVAE